MKVKLAPSDSRRAELRRRVIAGGLLAVAVSLMWRAPASHAQSPGMGALFQKHGRVSSRGDMPPRLDRGRESSGTQGRPRQTRQRAEHEAQERQGRYGRLSPDERRRLRQSLYEIGREMYEGN